MPSTLFEKIWNAHLIAEGSGGGLLLLDRILLHERTGGVALQSLRQAGHRIANPAHVFATMDHVVDTRPGRRSNAPDAPPNVFIDVTRREARAAGIHLFDVDDDRQGIVHVIGPELGIVLPGLTLVCPDSHTGTQGALGALAWGIGSTEAEHALATQTLRVPRPKTLRVTIDGALQRGVTAKDLALHLIATRGSAGGRGFVAEFAGPGVCGLDLEARMTLCNMATEFSVFAALIAPDERTYSYLRGRSFAPAGPFFERGLTDWRQLRSDPDARFDLEIRLDASEVRPMVTWGTNPQDALPIDSAVPDFPAVAGRLSLPAYRRTLEYMGLEPGRRIEGLPIDGAFIGACTNSRLSDLRRAAAILQGRKVAPGVRAICVPGSTRVKRMAEDEGLASVFERAGFEWRESGCSLCFFAGGESFAPGQRIVSSTNRNFEGRQGPQTRTHLASPETVAASAIAGYIADPRQACD
ncbi:MAG: 3-isopropylmalate dehydratase large subunit [Proteobacteria bacterium]|nr:3-isopropylmalate dehydratase large subunit [Pseudomonadota bacterium]